MQTHPASIKAIEQADHIDDMHFIMGTNYVTIQGTWDDDEDQPAWMYTIFADRTAYDNGDSEIDGGMCTGSLIDAIGMALSHLE